MRRKGGVVVPAVVVCFALVWGSVSSAWAGTGFRPRRAAVPGSGAAGYLAYLAFAERGSVVHAAVAEHVVVETAVELAEVVAVTVLLGRPLSVRATMTPKLAAHIAQAEFDH